MTTRNAFVLLASFALAACATTGGQVSPQQPTAEIASPPPQASASTEDSQTGTATAESDQKPCFTGRFIVADDGRIEMEGCPAEMEVFIPGGVGNADPPDSGYLVGRSLIKVPNPSKSQLLVGPDDQGRYTIPSEPTTTYFTFVDGTLYLNVDDCECGRVQSKALFPAYEVNRWVRDERKLTPFMMPDIMGPPAMEIVGNIQGELVDGRPFHMLSPRDQMARMFAVQGEGSGGDQE